MSYLVVLTLAASTAAAGEIRERPARLSPIPIAVPRRADYPTGVVRNVAIVYQNGDEHAENVELHVLGTGQMLLAFRGGGTGQTETPDARIRVFSFDPATYQGSLLSEVASAVATPPRGIRDPKLFSWQGRLKLSAISRQAGFPVRDLFSNARTVVAESMDEGHTFTVPAPALLKQSEDKTFGMWRYVRRREAGNVEALYATAYNDGDTIAAYFRSEDGGATFTRRGDILASPVDVPSEAELFFGGPRRETAIALVRLDNKGLLSAGQTAICTKHADANGMSGDFECSRRIEQRLDGPSEVFEARGRRFIVARKHLACTRKRTALYEMRGELADPKAPVSLCEVAELPSSGDTAYAAVAAIPGHRDEFVAAWYSTPLDTDLPWLAAQFAPSWILAARLDFTRYDPSICVPPAPVPVCPESELPAPVGPAPDGEYVLNLAPSFLPEQAVAFEAHARREKEGVRLTLQGLDHEGLTRGSRVPLGESFSATARTGSDGVSTFEFGSPTVPLSIFPLGTKLPGAFLFERFKLRMVPTAEGFCGNVEGDVVFQEVPGLLPPGTRLLFEGSTFAATREGGSARCP
jgi:hypothetical protein